MQWGVETLSGSRSAHSG